MNNKNKKIMILYHSGAGSTQTVAEVFHEKLKEFFICRLEAISFDYDFKKLEAYDFIIFGCPTYHCEPSGSMMEFIERMPKFEKKKNIFFFVTYGLFSGNTERIFIKACKNKNINIIGSNGYKAPATDGALLMPQWKFLFRYGRRVPEKIGEDLQFIKKQIKSNEFSSNYSVRFKLYSLFNYPNKFFGKKFTFSLSIMSERCNECNQCVNECIRNAWVNQEGKILWDSSNCESCFKCVHHCPREAIILSEKTIKKPKFNHAFYTYLKKEILKNI